MSSVAATLSLDDKTAWSAKQAALNWMSAGPCKQPNTGANGGTAISLVIGAAGKNTFEIAVLAMIGILSRENLGREPPENICRFAKDLGR